MPAAYNADSVRLMGAVRHHKLLASSQQTVQSYNPKKNLEEAMWNAEFGGESMALYATKPGTIIVLASLLQEAMQSLTGCRECACANSSALRQA